MRPAKRCIVLTALCLVAACAGKDLTDPPRASTGAASYQAIPCPQPNIAGFPDLDFPSGVQCGYKDTHAPLLRIALHSGVAAQRWRLANYMRRRRQSRAPDPAREFAATQ